LSIPSTYQRNVHQLAMGFEPIDLLRQQRTALPVRIDVESPLGTPHQSNRVYSQVNSVSDVVPKIGRDEYGIHRMLYLKNHATPSELTVRIHDDHRQFVPRRFRINIPARVDSHVEQRPLVSRKQTPMLFPGAAYNTHESCTGLRGRVLRNGKPMRWAWVDAFLLSPRLELRGRIGRAISDDRGEFLLILNTLPLNSTVVAELSDPLLVKVVINGPKVPPLASQKNDPLWDVPIEQLLINGASDPVMADDDYLPTNYEASEDFVFELP